MASFDNPQPEPQPDSKPELPQAVQPRIEDQVNFQGTGSGLSLPPTENPVWNGWDVLLIAVVELFTLIAMQFLTAVAAWRLEYSQSNFGDVLQKPLVALLGQLLSYICWALYMVMLVEGKYHVQFWQAIRWNWRGRAVISLLGLGVLTVSLDILGRFLPIPQTTPFDQMFSRPVNAYLIAVFAVTVGPLMEELFFRGFLYPVIARRTGIRFAILLTALPFGLMHYLQYRSWAAVLIVTLVGVVLTVVRVIKNSVAASFLVHVGYNATLMLLTALVTDGFQHMERGMLLSPFSH